MHHILEFLNSTAFDLDGTPTSWAELLGFVTGLASVGLAALGRISNFAFGVLNAVCFGALFVDARLFADASLQLMFFALCVHGWWAWLRLGPRASERPVTHASARLLGYVGAGTALAVLVLIPVLRAAGDSAPVLDALTTGLSIGAQVLLNLKKVENWYLWIVADLIYVPLYLSRELVLTATVYVAFLLICLVALRSWRAATAKVAIA
jgi:nicotinamide mononucleotide transporter